MQNWYLHFSLNKTGLYFVYLKKNLKYKTGHELCISQVPLVKDICPLWVERLDRYLSSTGSL